MIAAVMAFAHITLSRSEFAYQLSLVQEGETCAQVEARLGKPDDIWDERDPTYYCERDGEITWCYGNSGHLTFATLGRISFKDGKVSYLWMNAGYDSYPQIIPLPESQIRRLLNVLYQPPSIDYRPCDPDQLVRAANALRPLGKDNALAILCEYDRVYGWNDSEFLYCILKVLFESASKAGSSYSDLPGAPTIEPPADPNLFPTYPIFFVDDVPFSVNQGYAMGGFPLPFPRYVRDHRSEWKLRTSELKPPDDPFALYERAVADPSWKVVTEGGHPVDPGRIAELIREYILQMTRTAYQAPRSSLVAPNMEADDFAAYHRAFLATHPRWDREKQLYVRGDGSYNRPGKPERKRRFEFRGIPHMQLSITYGRMSETWADFGFKCIESGNSRLPVSIIRILDVSTGEELAWQPLDVPMVDYSKAKTRARGLHHPASVELSGPFEVLTRTRIQFVVEVGGRKYRSEVLKL